MSSTCIIEKQSKDRLSGDEMFSLQTFGWPDFSRTLVRCSKFSLRQEKYFLSARDHSTAFIIAHVNRCTVSSTWWNEFSRKTIVSGCVRKMFPAKREDAGCNDVGLDVADALTRKNHRQPALFSQSAASSWENDDLSSQIQSCYTHVG